MTPTLYFLVTLCISTQPCGHLPIAVADNSYTLEKCLAARPEPDESHRSFCVPYKVEQP